MRDKYEACVTAYGQNLERACKPQAGDKFKRGDVEIEVIRVYAPEPGGEVMVWLERWSGGNMEEAWGNSLSKYEAQVHKTLAKGAEFIPAKS